MIATMWPRSAKVDMSEDAPLRNKQHCPICGAPTTTTCKNCGHPIRGCHYLAGAYGTRHENSPSKAPAFCEACGHPYPWTESHIEAARDLAGQLDLDIPERAILEKSILEMIRDTPRAPAEAARFKGMVEKAKPWALGAFREVLFGVVSESVKKIVWP